MRYFDSTSITTHPPTVHPPACINPRCREVTSPSLSSPPPPLPPPQKPSPLRGTGPRWKHNTTTTTTSTKKAKHFGRCMGNRLHFLLRWVPSWRACSKSSPKFVHRCRCCRVAGDLNANGLGTSVIFRSPRICGCQFAIMLLQELLANKTASWERLMDWHIVSSTFVGKKGPEKLA